MDCVGLEKKLSSIELSEGLTDVRSLNKKLVVISQNIPTCPVLMCPKECKLKDEKYVFCDKFHEYVQIFSYSFETLYERALKLSESQVD